MLVLKTDDAWQLVAQVNHATLSGELATSWGAGPFAPCDAALVIAAFRHDEGWAVWDRHPLLADGGEPMSFWQAPVRALLSSYAAAADMLAYEHPHAGLLVSRHVSGLRRGRYGLSPDSASRRSYIPVAGDDPAVMQDPAIMRFVAEEEWRQARLCAQLGLAAAERDHQYAQLQLFDVLSLKLCLTDLRVPGEVQQLDLAPTAPGERDTPLSLRPLGGGHVAVQPWPFALDALEVSVPRRLLRPGAFADLHELRSAFSQAPIDLLRIELCR